MYYVYTLKSKHAKKMYIGYTHDLRTRISEHNKGHSPATKPYAPFCLIYYEAYKCKKDACAREKQLKQYKQAWTRLKERIRFSLEEQN